MTILENLNNPLLKQLLKVTFLDLQGSYLIK